MSLGLHLAWFVPPGLPDLVPLLATTSYPQSFTRDPSPNPPYPPKLHALTPIPSTPLPPLTGALASDSGGPVAASSGARPARHCRRIAREALVATLPPAGDRASHR